MGNGCFKPPKYILFLLQRGLTLRKDTGLGNSVEPLGIPRASDGYGKDPIRRSEWLGTNMNQGVTREQALVAIRPPPKRELMLVDVAEVPALQGEFILPAVNQVRLALALFDFSASWRGSKGLLSKTVSAGMTTICKFNQPRRLEMRNSTSYAIVRCGMKFWSRPCTIPDSRELNCRSVTMSKMRSCAIS